MDTPRTLRSFSGLPTYPAAFDRAALVIVDAQQEYLPDGNLPLDGIGAAVEETARLLHLARRHGAPVFHIVHHGTAGSPVFDPEAPQSAIIPVLTPRDGEAVITKALPNAFAGTDLHARLTASGRTELVVAGFMTHMCISATVRAAFDLGYQNTVVAAATATRDLPNPAGGVVPAAELQRNELAALADLFAVVVNDSGTLA